MKDLSFLLDYFIIKTIKLQEKEKIMAWILMAGCDGFGNDAYVASNIVFTNYDEAYAEGVAITKKAVSNFSKSRYQKEAKFAKKYDAASYEGGLYYYAVPVKVIIH